MNGEVVNQDGPAAGTSNAPSQPSSVGRTGFKAERVAPRDRDKAHADEGGAIAASRRCLPRVGVDADLTVTGPDGVISLRDAFEAADMASDVPNVHDEIAQGLKDHSARKGMRFNILITLVEIGGSIALFQLAHHMGASNVVSYLAGSIGPLVGGIAIWVKARKFSGASASIFAFTAVSAILALIASSTPKVLLYKDCATTALIGLIFLGSSVLARKPLVFYFAQRYGTDGTHDGMAIFDTMWDTYRDFREGMYVTNYLWAALFLVQAGGTALIIDQSTYSTAYTYNQILPVVATALGIIGSIVIGRYFTKKGKARGAAADSAHSDPA